ncbi:MAG: stage II sporulation protein M [Planctomycetota bacterium]|nr:stage II sporulation protein M [Planctomycetota bacterium]
MSDFVSRHKHIWTELESLVERGKKNSGAMTVDELGRLDSLYRQTTVHLSQVNTYTRDRNLANYLSHLTGAAHTLIYLPPRKRMFEGLLGLLSVGIAKSIASQWRYHLLALVLFLGGGLIGYFATWTDPLVGYAIMPAMMEGRGPGATPEQLRDGLRSGRDQDDGSKFQFAAFLFLNNSKVAILVMATGILVAFPSVLILFYNGMVLGVFVAVHHRAGIYTEMWAWILPHGITEMGAIILAGGVGLHLGKSVLAPGQFSRSECLKRVGKEAGTIVAASILMLIFAAIVESYLRQSYWSSSARLGFAMATLLFWILYIGAGFFLNRAEAPPIDSRRLNSPTPAG